VVVTPALVTPAVKGVTTTVQKAAEEAKGAAAETVHDVRERILELRHDTKLQHEKKRHRGRSLVILVLVAVGCAAFAMYLKRRREAEDYGPSSDAFGAAVVEQSRASNGGRTPVATPGA
jgi:hypothetical protein